jgi:hypothetical protein
VKRATSLHNVTPRAARWPGASAAVVVVKAISIVGCPRSGTTLLASLLGSHPAVVSPPEAAFLLDLAERFRPGERVDPAELWSFIAHHERFRLWGEPMPPAPAWSASRVTIEEVVQGFLRAYARTRGKPEAQLWVEHSPQSALRHVAFERLFGDSLLVHIRRDGRAVAASLLSVDFGPNDIFNAAEYWLRHLAIGELAVAAVGRRGLRVRYEDLLGDPRATLAPILARVGLDFRAEMLAGDGLKLSGYQDSTHALIGAGVQAAPAERWRTTLTAREIEIFEHVVGDALTYLGYAPVTSPPRRRPRGSERRWHALRAEFRRRINKLRHRRRRRRVEA